VVKQEIQLRDAFLKRAQRGFFEWFSNRVAGQIFWPAFFFD